jgi:signal peptidase II
MMKIPLIKIDFTKLQKLILLLALLFAGCSSDIHTKVIAKQGLKFNQVTVIENYFSLTYVENHAVAMGLMKSIDRHIRVPLILTLQAIICLAGLLILWRIRHQKISLQVGLAILLSGAMGNFFDRLQHGFVTDFFHFHYLDKFSFPVFNVADVLINIGMIILLFQARSFENALNAAFSKDASNEPALCDSGELGKQ